MDGEWFFGHEFVITEEPGKGRIVDTAGRSAFSFDAVGFGIGGRDGGSLMLIDVVIGKIAREVADNGVKRPGPEELESVLPVFRVHQLGVGDDLDGQRLERLMELSEPLALAISHQSMELVGGVGIAGDFVDVVVESLGVLDVEAPLSPPSSEVMHSDSCACSPAADLESHGYSSNPPSRSMSFSGSESGPFVPDLNRSHVHDDDETSQSDDCESAVNSDCAESPSSLDETHEEEHVHDGFDDEDFEDEFPVAQFPEDAIDAFDFNNDTLDSDTPTPRQETIASCYIEYKSVVSRRLPSPHRRSPSPSPKYHFAPNRESSFMEIRRSPDESFSKIQKPTPDPIRRRVVNRRRLD